MAFFCPFKCPCEENRFLGPKEFHDLYILEICSVDILTRLKQGICIYNICEICQDMGIDDPEFVELANQIEELEQKLFSHPLHKVHAKEFLSRSFGFTLLLCFPYLHNTARISWHS